MEPINYTLDVKDPFDSALAGVSAGLGLRAAKDQAEQRKLAAQRQQAVRSGVAAFVQKPSKTGKDYGQAILEFPEMADQFKSAWATIKPEHQEARLGQISQIFSALNSGQPEMAAKLASDHSTALKNSGYAQDAQQMDTLAQVIPINPDAAETSLGLLSASIMGVDRFAPTLDAMNKMRGEIATGDQKRYEANNTPERLALENNLKAAEVRNIDDTIRNRSDRLGLDRDTFQSQVEQRLYEFQQKLDPAINLDADGRKLINESTIASIEADQSGAQMLRLATDLENTGGGYGKASGFGEWYKRTTGNQGAITALRKEYSRTRAKKVVEMLPPGQASDRDISIFMEGFPEDTADAKHIAAFLRVQSAISAYEAETERAKAEWVNSVGHLGNPKRDIVIEGINVPAGTSFSGFTRQFTDARVKQRQKQQEQKNLPNRSYMRHSQSEAQ